MNAVREFSIRKKIVTRKLFDLNIFIIIILITNPITDIPLIHYLRDIYVQGATNIILQLHMLQEK